MNQIFIIIFIVLSAQTYAQTKLNFEYDVSGNQIKRYYKITILAKKTEKLEIEKDDKVFEVFPNPTTGPLTLRWGKEEIESIKLFNLMGQEIHGNKLIRSNDGITLNLSHLPKAVYIIHFITKKGKVITKKIIKK